jgi:hypothetical protein
MASVGQLEQKPRKEERLVDPTVLWRDPTQRVAGDLTTGKIAAEGDGYALHRSRNAQVEPQICHRTAKHTCESNRGTAASRTLTAILITAVMVLAGRFVWTNLGFVLSLSWFGRFSLLAVLALVFNLAVWAARRIWRGC